MQPLCIKETCLYVEDLDRSRVFYEGTLDLPCFSFVPGNHAFFRAGGSVLLCFLKGTTVSQTALPPHWAEGQPHFALEVDRGAEYERWLEELRKKGVAIEHEHLWPGGFRSVYFRDPDQACVEIIEAGMWEYRADPREP